MTTTSEEVWQLLKELIEAQKETEKGFQEIKERFAQTDVFLKENAQKSDRRFRETERLLKEQSKKTDEQIGKLGNRLGEFVEWQVRPAVVRLFQDRDIDVHLHLPDVSVKRATGGIQRMW